MKSLFPEFEYLDLLWFEKWRLYGVKILQGEYCVSDQNIVMTAVLGSCISACVYDCKNGLGGMNHFMLPNSQNNHDSSRSLRYGLFSMEQLINSLLKRGSFKEDLRFKIVGGGRMLNCLTDIGQLNIAFIKNYLAEEQLKIENFDLGGGQARKLAFFPATGRLLVTLIPRIDSESFITKESLQADVNVKKIVEHQVELF